MELDTNQPDIGGPKPAAPHTADRRDRRWIVSVFGDVTRTGPWPAGRRLAPVAVFGDIDLDLRQAVSPAARPAGELAVNAIAPFGNIDVLVPDGAEVDVRGFTLFGSKRISVREGPAGAPALIVRVRGVTLFGSFRVWTP